MVFKSKQNHPKLFGTPRWRDVVDYGKETCFKREGLPLASHKQGELSKNGIEGSSLELRRKKRKTDHDSVPGGGGLVGGSKRPYQSFRESLPGLTCAVRRD